MSPARKPIDYRAITRKLNKARRTARAVRNQACNSAMVMRSVAEQIGARGLIDVADELRLEADQLEQVVRA